MLFLTRLSEASRGTQTAPLLDHPSQVTNEQVTFIVNRDHGRMLTKTVVEEITI
jgi:hypothetical protein